MTTSKEQAFFDKIYNRMLVEIRCALTIGKTDHNEEAWSIEEQDGFIEEYDTEIKTATLEMIQELDESELENPENDWVREYCFPHLENTGLFEEN